MKIIVATVARPFDGADGRELVAGLLEACRGRGHEVDALMLPFHPPTAHLASQMVGIRLLDLSAYADLVITLRGPSHLVRHPRKIVWFAGHHRAAYDLWGTPWSDLHDTEDGRVLRDVVRAADAEALRDARRVVATSRVVARRLLRFNGITAPVVRVPPAGDVAVVSGRPTRYGDAVHLVESGDDASRQLLAIEAMRFVRTGVRLVAAVADPARAARHVAEHGLTDRVVLVEPHESSEQTRSAIGEALAVVHAPYDADGYGSATANAFAAARAVVTTYDSGGVREAVEDGVSGVVCRPTPRALARAFDRLYRDRGLARRLGEGGRDRLRRDLAASWDATVEQLLA